MGPRGRAWRLIVATRRRSALSAAHVVRRPSARAELHAGAPWPSSVWSPPRACERGSAVGGSSATPPPPPSQLTTTPDGRRTVRPVTRVQDTATTRPSAARRRLRAELPGAGWRPPRRGHRVGQSTAGRRRDGRSARRRSFRRRGADRTATGVARASGDDAAQDAVSSDDGGRGAARTADASRRRRRPRRVVQRKTQAPAPATS